MLSKEQIAQCLSLPKFSPKFQTHVYTRFSFQEFEGRADISDISTLSKFQHLQQVDVSKGKIQSLAALRDLHGLYDLDASYNGLVEVLDFEHQTAPTLKRLGREGNHIGITVAKG